MGSVTTDLSQPVGFGPLPRLAVHDLAVSGETGILGVEPMLIDWTFNAQLTEATHPFAPSFT